MTRTVTEDLALPAAIISFNGLYTQSGSFLMMNQMRLLIVFALAVAIVLVALVLALVQYLRGRKAQKQKAAIQV